MINAFEYIGVRDSNWVLHKVKGSKFIARVFASNSNTEVKSILNAIKLEYPDATHWCWASITHFPNTELKANDNGEPNGTAGLPILRQLQSANVYNAFLVVVRYFGGTKLGTRGLIDAYSAAASLALQNCTFGTFELLKMATLECPMEKENILYIITNKLGLSVLNSIYNLKSVTMQIAFPLTKKESLIHLLAQYYEVKVTWVD